MTTGDYPRLREQAARAAYQRLRPMLTPSTVHLLSVADIAAAITVASDILTPADTDAATRLPAALRELTRLQHLNQAQAAAAKQARQFADRLAVATAMLAGRDLSAVASGPLLWREGLQIIDEIATANHRPPPSRMQPGQR